MRNYVIINGINSLTIQGLAINNLPPITKPMIRTQIEEIDGRDGDIVTELGYGAYDKQMEIGLWGTYDIDAIIKYFTGEGTITFSSEPDKYYYFKILNQIDYEKLLKFKTATITMHCQPFKYPVEETPITGTPTTIEEEGESITIDNTLEAPMKIVYKGNTYQDSTTGKNLLNLVGTYTEHGVTSTGTNDGKLVCSGTCDAAYFTISNGNIAQTLPAGTYTFSIDKALSFGVVLRCIYASSTPQANKKITAGNTSVTFTIDEPVAYLRVYAEGNISSGTNINATFYPMLESGNTATSFEPYTNGASPNPDYPQDIHVVSGDNTINVEGKNLLDFDSFLQYSNVVYTKSGATYNITDKGNIISNRYPLNLKPNTTYTLSCSETTNSVSALRTQIYQGSTYLTRVIASGSSEKSTTFTTDSSSSYYMNMTFTGDTSYPLVWKNVQLELGNQATTYQAFQGKSSYQVNLGSLELCKIGTYQDKFIRTRGKNLVDILNGTIVKRESATYTNINRTANTLSYNITTAVAGYLGFVIPIEIGKQYTLSFDRTSGYIYTIELDNMITEVGTNYGSPRTSGYSFTATKPYIGIWAIANTDGGSYASISNLILNEGTTALPYEPYGNGDWYLEKKIKKIVLDGTTDGLKFTSAEISRNKRFSLILNDVLKQNYSLNIDNKSNYFTYNTDVYRDGGDEIGFIINSTQLYVRFGSSSELDTITKANAWLSTHNTIFYYILATPTYTLIEGELLNQLEAIKMSYEGQTNISQTNNDLPFIMDVSALELGSDHLIINNTGTAYSKPTIDIEGTGIVDIYLNDEQIFEIDMTTQNEIIIDTEKMDAYTPDNLLANRLVTGDYSNFKLAPGENDLRFSGDLTKATVTRYIRWI